MNGYKGITMHLYIAYKNYSSWSLRPWIAMKVAGIEFKETLLPFYHNDSLRELATNENIPACVPILQDRLNGEVQTIWDSMSIMEYLAERHPQLWPKDLALRAMARSVSAEMHSGFMALRREFPMNCRVQKQGQPSEQALKDLARIAIIWERFANYPNKPEGPFLCGQFTIVDAMYAPVLWRVVGYQLDVSPLFVQWIIAMQALPAMQEWLAAAEIETWHIPEYDAVAS
jgi:glutathione S-transferase